MKEKGKIKRIINKISKIISSILLGVLVAIGMFLVYYLISAKMVAKNPMYTPKINLYTIVSGSMEPAIKVYDVIVDYKVSGPEKIKKGDVITFRSTSSISRDLIVTHRVQDIKIVNGMYEYVTKGDYNATADSSNATYDNIIGKVVFRFPQLGRIQFLLAQKMGWFIIVLLPASCVIIYDIIKLVKLILLRKSADQVMPSSHNNNSDDDYHKYLDQIKN